MQDTSPLSDSDFELFRRTRSELAVSLLQIKGKPLNLNDFPMFKAIYDGDFKSMVLKTSRQVGKSTTLAGFGIIESISRPHFQTIFVTPTGEQTRRFSTLKIGKMLQYSPFVRKYYLGDKTANRVLLRIMTNASEMAFSYAAEDADRVRGLSGDRICLDEYQDMLADAIEPVVEECMSASKYRFLMRCGTPKTMENSIETKWEQSTQSEWIIPCKKCNKWNAIRSEEYFGRMGPICRGCKNYINPRDGQWLDFRPNADIKGFHISRPCMPETVPICWREGTKEYEEAVGAWEEVWQKLNGVSKYPISLFRNEVVGVSDSIGRRLVTIDKLRSMQVAPPCEEAINEREGGNCYQVGRIAIGIDWSGGGADIKSRTVMVVIGLTAQLKMRLLFYKIFPGVNPVDENREIAATIEHFHRVGIVACDRGEGNMPTDMLRHKFGKKVIKINYTKAGYYAAWNKDNYLSVNRSSAIDSLMMTFNNGEWEFPKDDPQIDVIFQDILAEFEEVTKSGYKVWRHAATKPDDALHALNFARIALQLQMGSLDLTSHPSDE